MANTVLIHGYGAGLEVLPFIKPPKTHSYEFKAFTPQIEAKNTEIFTWEISKSVGILKSLEPLTYLDLYRKEQALAGNLEILQKLAHFLFKHSPEIIIAHSMGAQLILNLLKTSNLPKSLKALIFVQADVASFATLQNKDARQRIKEKNLVWLNYYCPRDTILPLSWVINRRIPAGLKGIKNSFVKNIHFHLDPKIRMNLHVSSISDPRFLKEITQLVDQPTT